MRGGAFFLWVCLAPCIAHLHVRCAARVYAPMHTLLVLLLGMANMHNTRNENTRTRNTKPHASHSAIRGLSNYMFYEAQRMASDGRGGSGKLDG